MGLITLDEIIMRYHYMVSKYIGRCDNKSLI